MSFPFDAYLDNNSTGNPASKTVHDNVHENRVNGLPMSSTLEWALRHKHNETNNIITNLTTNANQANAPPGNNINLRRTAGDVKRKEKEKVENDPGFIIKYLPFVLLVLVIAYFFFMSQDTKTIKSIDGIYKPNEALLYARNIACEVQPH